MVDVNDKIARLQVTKVRQEGARGRLAPLVNLAFLLEDVGLRPELELRLR